MTSEAPRRTLTGLKPKAAPSGNGRLIRSNRIPATPPPAVVTPEPAARAVPTEPVSAGLTESQSLVLESGLPKYQQLRRREARMYDDQADALTRLSRQLNKARRRPDGTTVGERITDNTLLRVAIDLLLARADELSGTTERELAASLGLQPRREDQA